MVRTRSFQYKESEQYHPLSDHGLKIVELVRNTKTQLDFIKQNSSFFAGRDDARNSAYKHHAQIWNTLLEGQHDLTSGMQSKQIEAYFDIATGNKVAVDFQETAKPAAELTSKAPSR